MVLFVLLYFGPHAGASVAYAEKCEAIVGLKGVHAPRVFDATRSSSQCHAQVQKSSKCSFLNGNEVF